MVPLLYSKSLELSRFSKGNLAIRSSGKVYSYALRSILGISITRGNWSANIVNSFNPFRLLLVTLP